MNMGVGRRTRAGRSFLHQMQGEAAQLLLEIDGLGAGPLASVLRLDSVKLHALKAQVVDGAVHIVGADGNVAWAPRAGALLHSTAEPAKSEELPALYSKPKMAHRALAVRSAWPASWQLMPT